VLERHRGAEHHSASKRALLTKRRLQCPSRKTSSAALHEGIALFVAASRTG
jgi:hypothetical protein